MLKKIVLGLAAVAVSSAALAHGGRGHEREWRHHQYRQHQLAHRHHGWQEHRLGRVHEQGRRPVAYAPTPATASVDLHVPF